MTILERITREVRALPADQRKVALKFLRSIRTRPAIAKKPVRKTLGNARSAIRAVRGMWRNRADLPTDTVEASTERSRRLMRRDGNGH